MVPQTFPYLVDCRPIHAGQAIEAAELEILETRVEKLWVPWKSCSYGMRDPIPVKQELRR